MGEFRLGVSRLPADNPPWTPAQLPDVVARWKGTLGVTDAGAGAVSNWADQSGNGNDLAQSTGANRPLTGSQSLNGKNAILFDGVNDDLHTASSTPFSFLHKAVGTILIVAKTITTVGQNSAWGGTCDIDESVTTRQPGILIVDGGNGAGAVCAAVTNTSSQYVYKDGAVPATGTWTEIVIRSDPTNGTAADRCKVYKNNGAVEATNALTNTNSSAASFATFTLGCAGGHIADNRCSNVAIAECIVMSSLITPSDQGDWVGYCYREYGLAP